MERLVGVVGRRPAAAAAAAVGRWEDTREGSVVVLDIDMMG
jgi:hypothetical protein